MIEEYQNCSNTDLCLLQATNDGRLAVATTMTHAMNNFLVAPREIHCFEDRVHFQRYPVSILIEINHSMSDSISKYIQYALEGGLFVKWLNDVKSSYRTPNNVFHVQLTNQHLFLAWLFFLLFTFFSIGAFIFEHIVRLN